MILEAKPDTINGKDVFSLVSDAKDNDAAIREIEDWCRRHNCVPSSERQLNVQQRDGMVTRYGLAYPAGTIVALGNEIYRRVVAPRMTQSDIGKVVAIDCVTEDYAVAANELQAIDALERQHPDAQAYLKRIGYTALAGVGTIVPRSSEF